MEEPQEKELVAEIELALSSVRACTDRNLCCSLWMYITDGMWRVQLSDTIDAMNTYTSTTLVKTQEAVLQRYRELHFDFKTEFRRSMVCEE